MPSDRPPLRAGERIDSLGRGGLVIIQRDDGTSFGLDAILLAHFARVRRGSRVIDLGTGTGVIALLLSALTAASTIDAIELDADLAEMASRSVALNGLDERIAIRHGDLRQAERLYTAGAYGTVVANPPYFPAESGRISPSPARAASRADLTCTIADVCRAARHLLATRGRFAFVYRPEWLVDTFVACRASGLEPKRLRLVQPEPARAPNLAMVEAVAGARPGLSVERPLIVRENGEYTAEMRSLYGEVATGPP